jgi:hypothetical protein
LAKFRQARAVATDLSDDLKSASEFERTLDGIIIRASNVEFDAVKKRVTAFAKQHVPTVAAMHAELEAKLAFHDIALRRSVFNRFGEYLAIFEEALVKARRMDEVDFEYAKLISRIYNEAIVHSDRRGRVWELGNEFIRDEVPKKEDLAHQFAVRRPWVRRHE